MARYSRKIWQPKTACRKWIPHSTHVQIDKLTQGNCTIVAMQTLYCERYGERLAIMSANNTIYGEMFQATEHQTPKFTHTG